MEYTAQKSYLFSNFKKVYALRDRGTVHKLCNTKEGKGGGLAKRYHAVLIFLKLIKILTQSVTWGGGGLKWPIFALHNLWTAP